MLSFHTHNRQESGRGRLFLLLILLLFSASSAWAACVQGIDGASNRSFVLYAGQNIPVGTVTVQVQDEALSVEYKVDALGWYLSEAHLWVGIHAQGYPQTAKGNPIPGQFPYKSGDLGKVSYYQFMVPLHLIPFQCPAEGADDYSQTIFMAAHAAVVKVKDGIILQKETGWSEGNRIVEKGNWATMSSFVMTCQCGGVEEFRCETAFARDPDASENVCFLNIAQLSANRWGWTNGPYNMSQVYFIQTLDLYAGAGLCDLSKGGKVGTVSVLSDMVIYQITTPGWGMEGAHLYIGETQVPRVTLGKKTEWTVAPGQYPYQSEDLNMVTEYRFPFTGIEGLNYVIAHAEVCFRK